MNHLCIITLLVRASARDDWPMSLWLDFVSFPAYVLGVSLSTGVFFIIAGTTEALGFFALLTVNDGPAFLWLYLCHPCPWLLLRPCSNRSVLYYYQDRRHYCKTWYRPGSLFDLSEPCMEGDVALLIVGVVSKMTRRSSGDVNPRIPASERLLLM